MVAKAVLLFCAQALLAQCISSQCIGAGYGIEGLARGSFSTQYLTEAPFTASWAAGPCAATPYATAEWATGYAPAASNGGSFPVTSASPLPVTGVSMTSENVYEGPLSVVGAVPFLGGVALEGALPTAGAGGITYACGNGNVGMLSEDFNGFNAYAGPYGYGAGGMGYGYSPLALEAGIAGPGYGYGYNRGCGCNAVY